MPERIEDIYAVLYGVLGNSGMRCQNNHDESKMIDPWETAHMVFEIADHPWINHVPVKMWRVQNGGIHQPLELLHRIMACWEWQVHPRGFKHERCIPNLRVLPTLPLTVSSSLCRFPPSHALTSST